MLNPPSGLTPQETLEWLDLYDKCKAMMAALSPSGRFSQLDRGLAELQQVIGPFSGTDKTIRALRVIVLLCQTWDELIPRDNGLLY